MEIMEKYHLGIFPSFPFLKWSTCNKVVCKVELKKKKKRLMGLLHLNFHGLNFFLIILNETIVKCVIRFSRFVKKIKDQWKN